MNVCDMPQSLPRSADLSRRSKFEDRLVGSQLMLISGTRQIWWAETTSRPVAPRVTATWLQALSSRTSRFLRLSLVPTHRVIARVWKSAAPIGVAQPYCFRYACDT